MFQPTTVPFARVRLQCYALGMSTKCSIAYVTNKAHLYREAFDADGVVHLEVTQHCGACGKSEEDVTVTFELTTWKALIADYLAHEAQRAKADEEYTLRASTCPGYVAGKSLFGWDYCEACKTSICKKPD